MSDHPLANQDPQQSSQPQNNSQSVKAPQPSGMTGGFDKEFGPRSAPLENISYGEIEHSPEIPLEVQEYIEKTDRQNIQLDKPVIHKGDPIVLPIQPVALPTITLPLTKQGLTDGLTAKVNQSVLWLSEWCIRVIKKFHGRVVYRPEEKQE